MPKSLDEIRSLLADVDRAVEPIAIKRAGDSDIKLIVFALHTLVGCVDELAEHVKALGE